MAHHDRVDDSRPPLDRLLAWPRVKDLTGLSRTTAWRLQKAGDFPPPVQVSPGRVGWRESEIIAWNGSRRPRAAAPAFLAPSSAHRPPAALSEVPGPTPTDRRPARARARPQGLEGQSSFEF